VKEIRYKSEASRKRDRVRKRFNNLRNNPKKWKEHLEMEQKMIKEFLDAK